MPDENNEEEGEDSRDTFISSGISLSERELSEAGSKFIVPMKSKIRMIGTSGGILLSRKILEHNGFKVGEYVDVILQHRDPTKEELLAERKWNQQRHKK